MTAAGRNARRLGRYEASTSRLLTVVSLAVVPVYVAQALAAERGAPLTTGLAALRLGIHGALAVDVVTRTVLTSNRLRFLATHKLDLISVLIPPLRAGREVIALRAILRRPGLGAFATVGACVIVGCTLVVYSAEHDHSDATIATLGDALWWAVVTTTTVGYGDEVPVTDQGRAMAVVLMLLGIAMVSVVTAHIAAYFVEDQRARPHPDADLTARLDRIERGLASLLSRGSEGGVDKEIVALVGGDDDAVEVAGGRAGGAGEAHDAGGSW